MLIQSLAEPLTDVKLRVLEGNEGTPYVYLTAQLRAGEQLYAIVEADGELELHQITSREDRARLWPTVNDYYGGRRDN